MLQIIFIESNFDFFFLIKNFNFRNPFSVFDELNFNHHNPEPFFSRFGQDNNGNNFYFNDFSNSENNMRSNTFQQQQQQPHQQERGIRVPNLPNIFYQQV